MTFQYEWWTVDVLEPTGRITYEYKGKNKEHVIKQIKRNVAESQKAAKDASIPRWEKPAEMKEVYWDTLTLDRTGYQRRF